MKSIVFPLSLSLISGILSYFVFSLFWIAMIILIIDANSRYKEYIKYKNKDLSNKKINKLIYKFKGSRCSRNVAIELFGKVARIKYRELGYKFYHIFPDNFPKCFISLRFWMSVFGIKLK